MHANVWAFELRLTRQTLCITLHEVIERKCQKIRIDEAEFVVNYTTIANKRNRTCNKAFFGLTKAWLILRRADFILLTNYNLCRPKYNNHV